MNTLVPLLWPCCRQNRAQKLSTTSEPHCDCLLKRRPRLPGRNLQNPDPLIELVAHKAEQIRVQDAAIDVGSSDGRAATGRTSQFHPTRHCRPGRTVGGRPTPAYSASCRLAAIPTRESDRLGHLQSVAAPEIAVNSDSSATRFGIIHSCCTF